MLTAAGIAAACAGNWIRAEAHHRASIARMKAVPYLTSTTDRPLLVSDMLGDRRGPGDIEAAKSLLQASIATSDAIGLAMHARLARRRFAQIAKDFGHMRLRRVFATRGGRPSSVLNQASPAASVAA